MVVQFDAMEMGIIVMDQILSRKENLQIKW